MVMNKIGSPFQGIIFYEVEASYGAGLAGVGAKPISDYIQNVRIGTGDRHDILRGFDSPLVKDLLKQTDEPTLHIEYLLQVGDNLLEDMDRKSCCTLQSLAFAIGSSICTNRADDNSSYFEVKGCKPGTIKIASTKNAAYTITVDYEASSIVTNDGSSASLANDPGALGGAVLAFNLAGSIQSGGANLAFICNSVDITIANGLNGYTNIGALTKSYLIEGEMNVTGSVDITLDGGGGIHMGDVLNNRVFSIILNTGAVANAPIITIPGCEFDNSEVDLNISGEAMMESASFTAVPSQCSAIFSMHTT